MFTYASILTRNPQIIFLALPMSTKHWSGHINVLIHLILVFVCLFKSSIMLGQPFNLCKCFLT